MIRSLIALSLLVMSALPSQADTCASVIAGAQMGPSPNFNSWPWRNACYVSWPGGYSNSRSAYERTCRNVPGFLHFEGDFGSNRNTCIFSALGNATAPTGRKNDSEEYRRFQEGVTRKLKDEAAREAAQTKARQEALLGDIRKLTKLQIRSTIASDWWQLYDVARKISDTYSGIDAIMAELNKVVDIDSELKKQECIKAYAERLNSWRISSDVAPECARYDDNELFRQLKQIKTSHDVMKKPSSNKWFGALTFADDPAFWGSSANKKDLSDAYTDSVATCYAMQRNNISYGMDKMTNCMRFFWVYNGCISTALTDDDKSYVTARRGDNIVELNKSALAECRLDTSSTLCRPGPQICSKGPNG